MNMTWSHNRDDIAGPVARIFCLSIERESSGGVEWFKLPMRREAYMAAHAADPVACKFEVLIPFEIYVPDGVSMNRITNAADEAMWQADFLTEQIKAELRRFFGEEIYAEKYGASDGRGPTDTRSEHQKLADTLEDGANSDIWFDADTDTTQQRIEATQAAMRSAAAVLRSLQV